MIVPNIECIEKMRQDPDFLYKFIPDHFNFADMTQSRWVSSFSVFPTFRYDSDDAVEIDASLVGQNTITLNSMISGAFR